MGTNPEIPRSAMEMLQMQNNDAESLLGVKSFGNEGISGQALGNTATGIRSAMDATAKRELGILRRLSDGIVEIAQKISAMNTVNLEDEDIIKITDGEVVAIDRDPMNLPFDIKISVSTPEKDDEKAQDLAFMLQTIGNGMDPSLQQLILADIARLKDMPVLAKKLIDWQPQPDPMDQKIKELQVALLEAQVQNEQAKGMENQADVTEKQTQADLNTAKAETERAKVRSLHSNADLEDLKFLQEKDGVKHQQDLEKNEQSFEHELGKKTMDTLLDNENPKGNAIGTAPRNISQYPSQNVPVMDMPAENLDDMINDQNIRI
jgi:hypothetical protein